MTIRRADPRMVPITSIRKDIDVLVDVLCEENEAYVMKNQDLFFVVLTPDRYFNIIKHSFAPDSKAEAFAEFEQYQENNIMPKNKTASDYVIKMRKAQRQRWKRQ